MSWKRQIRLKHRWHLSWGKAQRLEAIYHALELQKSGLEVKSNDNLLASINKGGKSQ